MKREIRRDGCGKKRSRSSKKTLPSSPPHLDLSATTAIFPSFDRSMFPLLLASASNLQNPNARSVLLRFLRFHLAVITTTASSSSTFLAPASLSLFPLLLTSSFSSVAAVSAEVVGAIALHSLEANTIIASDAGVLKGLMLALRSRSHRVAKAACNAVMDLSTSPIGREQLREASAVERLLYLFCQEASVPVPSVLFQDTENAGTRCFRKVSVKDELLALVLDTAVTLINSSSEDFTKRISTELVKIFFPLIRENWDNLKGSAPLINKSRQTISLQSTKYDLAETIFRLSMNQDHTAALESSEVEIIIFGTKESDFENFILTYWEKSPLILRGVLKNSEKANTIFNSLSDSFSIRTDGNIIDSILVGLVSCPPIASDELDITCFLTEVNNSLGSPIINGQDIRVLRTWQLSSGSAKEYTKQEEYFFGNGIDSSSAIPFSLHKCKEAFNHGYSIALRGVEFRFDKVAAVAECLADLFGQPSVGANLYISPPRSQGLARHYDDHCVFVWQLYGKKQWIISPRPTSMLPRLYEPLNSVSVSENNICEDMQVLIEEGDVLYIPRGYAHEAHTLIDESQSENGASADYSIHLTLAIEVELPFEWEGFAHVALHCWNEKRKKSFHYSVDSKLKRPSIMFPLLLHVSLKQIADHDPVFRKACLIAGILFSSDTNMNNHSENLILSQKATFSHVINKIDKNSSFLEAFKYIELAIQERDDNSLQWMRWLRHLPQKGEDDKIDYCNLFLILEDLVISYSDFVEDATVEFIRFKSEFSRCVVFEETCKSYEMVLEKYRNTRNQYMKGMLSLHRRP